MKLDNLKKALIKTLTILLGIISITVIISSFLGIYIIGVTSGYQLGRNQTVIDCNSSINQIISQIPTIASQVSPTPTQKPQPDVTRTYNYDWGGLDLWEAVNERRQELGVNPLNTSEELCTIASIRLNELLELGKLDNHEGFSNMTDRRPDLEWIFGKYSTVAEFLAMGGKTAEETVSLWENTLGHKKLLTGGEYVWGCIYAQDSFAVAITAF